MELSWIKLIHLLIALSAGLLFRKSQADTTCNAPLGMTTGVIFNSMIKATSSLSSLRGPEYARLHWKDGEGGWTAASHDSNQYLMVDLGAVGKITKVATQGRHDSQEWVTEYKLQYSNKTDGTFKTFTQNGVQRKFIGNSDSDSVKSNDINPPIYARYIRFNPILKRNYFSMRVELYGCLANSSVAMFDGSNFISYNIEKQRYQVVKSEWNVTFRFRTTEANGVIMAGYGTQGDYLVFQLVRGELMINVNLGSTDDVAGDSRFFIGGLLDDNQWHYVTYYRKRRAVRVDINSIHMHGHTNGSFSRIDLDRVITFGGTPDFHRPGIYRDEDIPNQNFKGCLENMNFNGQFDVIGTVKEDTSNPRLKVHNGQTYSCTSEVMVPASFPTHESRLIIENSQKSLSVSFKFRTYETRGVLLYNELFSGEPFQILIQDGIIKILIGDEATGVTINSDGAPVNDGLWHSVEVKLVDEEVQFMVDDFRSYTEYSSTPLNTYYIGSDKEKDSLGFLGCMLDLMIGGSKVDFQALTPAENEGIEVNTCGMYDWCTPNPCEHGGTCRASWGGFSCSCMTGYGGSTCHRALEKRSCVAIQRTSGFSGEYLIDIDGSGILEPFIVRCVFEDDMVWTELNHNSEEEIRVTGSNEPGSYKHDIDYNGVSMDQIRMLVSEADHCEQSIKYRCKQSILLNAPDGPQYGWWVSSTGEKMDYWGGAGPGTRKCACGIEGNCGNSNKWCNCDINDASEREDVGLLTQKPYLPVAQLRFGGLESPSSMAYHTLNPLRCRGEIQNPVTFRDEQAHLMFEIELTVESGFDVYLEFKTTVYPAVLLHAVHETEVDYLKLELTSDREMLFSLDYGAGMEFIRIETEQELTDNTWHRVFVEMDPLGMYMEIDEANGVPQQIPYGDRNVHFNLHRGMLFVGSTTSQTEGYVGCMRTLRMNGKTMDMIAASWKAYYVVEGCTGHCDSKPCMNKGMCMERYSTFDCNCEDTSFAGRICTQEVGVDLDEGSEVSYTIPSQESLDSEKDVILVGFSTVQNSEGRIVRIDSSTGESFMEIKLNSEGAIQFSFAFGVGTGEITEDIGSYADGNHHVVKVTRDAKDFSMMIDETSPKMETFDITDTTFTSPSKITVGSPDGNNRFTGCISRVRFNNFYPLKMFNPASQPSEITTRGLVVESSCGVEGATLAPTSKLPYPDFTYKMFSTAAPAQPSVAAIKTTGDKVSITFVVLVLFVALGAMLFVIGRYMNRHGGEYRTNEDKGVAEAEDADAAVRASDPNHQGERGREWFL